MDIHSMKREANGILFHAQESPRKIILIHTALALGVSVVLALISQLAESISSGGGLSGMGTQAAVETVQVVLQMVSTAAVPFWSAGLMFVMLRYLRSEHVVPRDLTAGFRRFGPILSSSLMRALQYVTRGFASAYLSVMLVMVTPFAAPLYRLSAMLEENPNLDPASANIEGLPGLFAATAILFLLVFGVLALPVYYRYRMVDYIIMDEGNTGGLKAMFQSRLMMHRRRWQLFRLDLSFWWFYAAELLLSVLSMGSLLAPLLGINLPVSENTAHWIFQLTAAAGHLGLYTMAGPKIELTYALCYRQFLQPAPPPPPKPAKEHPWNY